MRNKALFLGSSDIIYVVEIMLEEHNQIIDGFVYDKKDAVKLVKADAQMYITHDIVSITVKDNDIRLLYRDSNGEEVVSDYCIRELKCID